MPTVTITDVFTRMREVEISDCCPGRSGEGNRHAEPCGADLRGAGSIRVWEWNEAVWWACLPGGEGEAGDVVEQGGVLIDALHCSDRADRWIEHVAYYCTACGTCLAEGEHRDLEAAAEGHRVAAPT